MMATTAVSKATISGTRRAVSTSDAMLLVKEDHADYEEEGPQDEGKDDIDNEEENPAAIESVATHPWHGDIDDEERWYLEKLSKPRDRRADIARMREGRPANLHGPGKTDVKPAVAGAVQVGPTGLPTVQQLMAYSKKQHRVHFSELWGHAREPGVRESAARVAGAAGKLKALLDTQDAMVDVLERTLEIVKEARVQRFETLHERVRRLDTMMQEYKKEAQAHLDAQRRHELKRFAEHESFFKSRVANLLDNAQRVRDEDYLHPASRKIENAIKATHRDKDRAFRSSFAVQSTMWLALLALKMALALLWVVSCGGRCACAAGGRIFLNSQLDSVRRFKEVQKEGEVGGDAGIRTLSAGDG